MAGDCLLVTAGWIHAVHDGAREQPAVLPADAVRGGPVPAEDPRARPNHREVAGHDRPTAALGEQVVTAIE